ncbi:hypothetical protein TIFTF001_030414 [Ficus carica]|uniref:RING-type E3 ubiquitin transferase n=1 Tax=Ficus carica TaxID=3494 RepID=A0AA88DTI7_FICCA|nr:hypothetical protein TIFTF001_030414 [Ficus carica]
MDESPLLGSSIADDLIRSRRLVRRTPPPLRRAARLLRRASGRRMMLREPSVQVRESAAEELEERQSGWAYSRPVIVLDVLWNLAFIGSGVAVLALSVDEEPSEPLRLWVAGYALQCLVHVGCVVAEYWRRRGELAEAGGWESGADWSSSSSSGSDGEDVANDQSVVDDDNSVAKHLEYANTMFSFIWWVVGFYWVTTGGESLIRDSPQIYWLCITFLAFDVVFVLICVAVACLVGIAVCCCLPCIIAILYAVTDQEGATKEDIDNLPKFKFRVISDSEKVNGEIQESFRGVMVECSRDLQHSPIERPLSEEDAECCICLSVYDDETELRELPCRHHFHCACIDKWLHINATCPLCKFNILKASIQSSCEV